MGGSIQGGWHVPKVKSQHNTSDGPLNSRVWSAWSSGVTFAICNFAKTSLLARYSDEWCAKAESLGDDRVRHRGAHFP
jgi:hypothetical protein